MKRLIIIASLLTTVALADDAPPAPALPPGHVQVPPPAMFTREQIGPDVCMSMPEQGIIKVVPCPPTLPQRVEALEKRLNEMDRVAREQGR